MNTTPAPTRSSPIGAYTPMLTLGTALDWLGLHLRDQRVWPTESASAGEPKTTLGHPLPPAFVTATHPDAVAMSYAQHDPPPPSWAVMGSWPPDPGRLTGDPLGRFPRSLVRAGAPAADHRSSPVSPAQPRKLNACAADRHYRLTAVTNPKLVSRGGAERLL